jgi:hypothetical protein
MQLSILFWKIPEEFSLFCKIPSTNKIPIKQIPVLIQFLFIQIGWKYRFHGISAGSLIDKALHHFIIFGLRAKN